MTGVQTCALPISALDAQRVVRLQVLAGDVDEARPQRVPVRAVPERAPRDPAEPDDVPLDAVEGVSQPRRPAVEELVDAGPCPRVVRVQVVAPGAGREGRLDLVGVPMAVLNPKTSEPLVFEDEQGSLQPVTITLLGAESGVVRAERRVQVNRRFRRGLAQASKITAEETEAEALTALREMRKQGSTVASHDYTHEAHTKLDPEDIESIAIKSRDAGV